MISLAFDMLDSTGDRLKLLKGTTYPFRRTIRTPDVFYTRSGEDEMKQ
jgi:hypothetical protein